MFWSVTESLLQGFEVTLQIFVTTLVFALPLGLVISFGSMSKFRPVKWIVKTFVWIIRGTPLMLQLIVVFYGPGLILKVINASQWIYPEFIVDILTRMNAMQRITAVLIAFIINYACYFSEIYRGGIESISKGQYEACQVLGMTKTQTFFRVVLLQVIKRIIPPMGNEIITLVKDTSLARIISVYEIVYNAERLIKLEGIIWPLLYTAVFYLVFCGVVTIVFNRIEKRLDYFKA